VPSYARSTCGTSDNTSAATTGLQLAWTVVSADPAASSLFKSSASSISIPAGRLLPLYSYVFTLTVTDVSGGNRTAVSNAASVRYDVEAVPTPMLVQARFDDAATSVVLDFDAETNRANMTSASAQNTDCRMVLAGAFLASVGQLASTSTSGTGSATTVATTAGAKCLWASASSLLVILGAGATVTPSTPVELLWASLRSSDGFSAPMVSPSPSLTPLAPATPLKPVVLLRGSSSLSREEDVVLSGSTSQGHGGRSFILANWTLVPGSAFTQANDTAPIVPLVPSQIAPLQALLTTVTGVELRVPNALLLPGGSYTFSLKLSNFLGFTASATKVVKLSAISLPQVSVLEEPPAAPLSSEGVTAKVGVALPPSWPAAQPAVLECGWRVLPPHENIVLPAAMRNFSFTYVPAEEAAPTPAPLVRRFHTPTMSAQSGGSTEANGDASIAGGARRRLNAFVEPSPSAAPRAARVFSPHDGDDDEGMGRDQHYAHDGEYEDEGGDDETVSAAAATSSIVPPGAVNQFVWTHLPHQLLSSTIADESSQMAEAGGADHVRHNHRRRSATMSALSASLASSRRRAAASAPSGERPHRHAFSMRTLATGDSSSPTSGASLSTSAYFSLPPYLLVPGEIYQFVLQVTLRGANGSTTTTVTDGSGSGDSGLPQAMVFNSAKLSVSVARSSLVASITGGDRLVTLKQGVSVVLDASHSYDPDSLALTGRLFALGVTPSYSWSCTKVVTGLPCFSSGSAATAMTSTAATLSLSAKHFTEAMDVDPSGTAKGFAFQVSLGLSDGTGRTAQGLAVLTVTTQEVPSVTILKLFLAPRPNAADNIKFQALITPALDASSAYNLAWSLVAPAGVVLKSSDSDTGLSSIDLALRANTLQPGTTYTLQLLAWSSSAPGNIGRGQVSFTTNLPPSGGSCSATPVSGGRSIDNSFTFTCREWNDLQEDQPLMYAFILLDSSDGSDGSTSGVYLSSYSSTPSLVVDVMPAGKASSNFTQQVRVDIMDRLGAVTSTVISVQVLPSSLLDAGGNASTEAKTAVINTLTALVLGPAASSGNINAFAPAFLTAASLLPTTGGGSGGSGLNASAPIVWASPEEVLQRNTLMAQVTLLPNSVNTLATISQRVQLGNLVCNEPLSMDTTSRAMCAAHAAEQVALARESQFYAAGARAITGSGSGESAAANAAPVTAVPFSPALTKVLFGTVDSVIASTGAMLKDLAQQASASAAANGDAMVVAAGASKETMGFAPMMGAAGSGSPMRMSFASSRSDLNATITPLGSSGTITPINAAATADDTASVDNAALEAGQAEARAVVSMFLSVVHTVSQGSVINKLASEAPTVVRTDSMVLASQVHSMSSLAGASLDTRAMVANDGLDGSDSGTPASVSFPSSLFAQGSLSGPLASGQLESDIVASTFFSHSSDLYAYLSAESLNATGLTGYPSGNGRTLTGTVSISLFSPSTRAASKPNITSDAEAAALARDLGLDPPLGYGELHVQGLDRSPVRIAFEHEAIEQPEEFLRALADNSTSESEFRKVRLPQCRWFDASRNAWSTAGCMVDVAHSSATRTECLCTHLTDFSLGQADFDVVDLLVPSHLNILGAADVLNLTASNLAAHPIPLLCVLVVLGAYIVLVPMVHRWDVAQMVLWLEGKAWHRAHRDIAHLHLVERWIILLRATFVYRHLWLGVLYRRPGETFSAAQKLTACVSLLLGWMAISAFFRADNTPVYAADAPDAPSTARLFLADWLIGVYSSLLMLPIKMLVILLFRRSGKSWNRLYAEYHLLKAALIEDKQAMARITAQTGMKAVSLIGDSDEGSRSSRSSRPSALGDEAAEEEASRTNQPALDGEGEQDGDAREASRSSSNSSSSRGRSTVVRDEVRPSSPKAKTKVLELRTKEQLLLSIQSSETPRNIRRKLAAKQKAEVAAAAAATSAGSGGATTAQGAKSPLRLKSVTEASNEERSAVSNRSRNGGDESSKPAHEAPVSSRVRARSHPVRPGSADAAAAGVGSAAVGDSPLREPQLADLTWESIAAAAEAEAKADAAGADPRTDAVALEVSPSPLLPTRDLLDQHEDDAALHGAMGTNGADSVCLGVAPTPGDSVRSIDSSFGAADSLNPGGAASASSMSSAESIETKLAALLRHELGEDSTDEAAPTQAVPPGAVPSPLVPIRSFSTGMVSEPGVATVDEEDELALLKSKRARSESAAADAQSKLLASARGPATPKASPRTLLTSPVEEAKDDIPAASSHVVWSPVNLLENDAAATTGANAVAATQQQVVSPSPSSSGSGEEKRAGVEQKSGKKMLQPKKKRVLWQPPSEMSAPTAKLEGEATLPEHADAKANDSIPAVAAVAPNPGAGGKKKRQLWSPEWKDAPPSLDTAEAAALSPAPFSSPAEADGSVGGLDDGSAAVSPRRAQRKKRVLYNPQWLIDGPPATSDSLATAADASSFSAAAAFDGSLDSAGRMDALSASIAEELAQSEAASLAALRLLGMHDVANAAIAAHSNSHSLPPLTIAEAPGTLAALPLDVAWLASSGYSLADATSLQRMSLASSEHQHASLSAEEQARFAFVSGASAGDTSVAAGAATDAAPHALSIAAPRKPEPMAIEDVDTSLEAILRQARADAAKATAADAPLPASTALVPAGKGKGKGSKGAVSLVAADDVDRLDSGGWRLPHFMLYVAYTLCFLWCAGACFVVLLYGLKFDLLDAERGLDRATMATGWSSSAKWLANVLQAVAQDLVIFEPALIAVYTFMQLWLGTRGARWLTCCRATGDTGHETEAR